LWQDAQVRPEGVYVAKMCYRALIVEGDVPEDAKSSIDVLAKAGRVIRWNAVLGAEELVRQIDRLTVADVQVSRPSPDLRVRHVRKAGADYYLLFNEGADVLEFQLKLSARGKRILMDAMTGCHEPLPEQAPVVLAPHVLRVVAVVQG